MTLKERAPVELSPDLLDDGAGPALPLEAEGAAALIAGALSQLEAPAGAERAASSRRGVVVLLRRRPKLWIAGVVFAGSAAAAVGQQQFQWFAPAAPQHAEPAAAGSAPEQPEAARRAVGARPAPAEPPPVESAAPEPAPEGSAAVAVVGEPPLPVRTEPPLRAAAVEAAAEDLLERANGERRAQNYDAALASYDAVMARYPRTRQAQAARLAAASLRMEHLGDLDGAEALFNQGARAGALSADALYGLAEAKRRRGDHDAERRILERLLREHPDSPLSRSAGKRLSSLPK